MSAATLPAGDTPSRQDAWKMFNRISRRYDFLNRLLSLRQDVRCRKAVARALPPGQGLRMLDLATGTGDQILHLLETEANGRIASAEGLDLAEDMLAIGREKVAARGLADRVTLRPGDACALPVPDAAFDFATVSFGIRNVIDVPRALREMRRAVRPGGRVIVLEFGLPRPWLLRVPYLFYFRHVLPRIGSWLSGDAQAYRYLNRTVESFPYGEAFCELMRQAGLVGVRGEPVVLGVAWVYVGERPADG
jgi:demethylmenaquinone methyltransferase/2-methoxy-6-polyprenyl-1,4-benzoquinol methylase